MEENWGHNLGPYFARRLKFKKTGIQNLNLAMTFKGHGNVLTSHETYGPEYGNQQPYPSQESWSEISRGHKAEYALIPSVCQAQDEGYTSTDVMNRAHDHLLLLEPYQNF